MSDDKKKIIKYTGRDFNSIKNDLTQYARRYYPNTYKDFNEASFGSMMIDMVSYVGDQLSFYLDYQANESFLDTAVEFDNIIKLGKQQGYKYEQARTGHGTVAAYVLVPSDASGHGPDADYLPVLRAGSKFASTGGNIYTLNEDIDFSNTNNEIVVATVDDDTGAPTAYAIKSFGKVISGDIDIEVIPVGAFQKFLRLRLEAENIAEIVSITDSEGHEFFEVDYLSQDIVHTSVMNYDSDTKELAPNILKPVPVPRRFVVEQDTNFTYLQFGHGSDDQITTETLADPAEVILKTHAKNYTAEETFDPMDLLSTDKMGISPSDTTLTITYRLNTANTVNAGANTITGVVEPLFEFPTDQTLDDSWVLYVIGSLEVSNEEPVVGDISLPSTREIRQRILDIYATQNRAVTREDYVALAYRMPARFGSIKRAGVSQDAESLRRNLNMYIAAESFDGSLAQPNMVLKENLKMWINRYKMVNDTVDIIDASILNFGIFFEAISETGTNKFTLLNDINIRLQDELFFQKMEIGEALPLYEIAKIINTTPGVIDVTNIKILDRSGGLYSDFSYDFRENKTADGRWVIIPESVILEMKYPDIDIKGVIR